MNTKKKQPKKKAASKRVESFDLDIKDARQAEELVAYMMQLQACAGWLLLRQIMVGNIAVLEGMILDRVDPQTGKALTDAELDKVRDKRGIMKEMIEKPQQLIEMFKKQTGKTIETYDPYAVDVRQFNKNSEVGSPVARTLQY